MSNKFEFILSREELSNTASYIIDQAKSYGATDVQVEISEVVSNSVDVLSAQVENFESSYDSNMSLLVLKGHNKGAVSIAKFDKATIDLAVKQAIDIAKYTEADPLNSLLESKYLAHELVLNDYLQLYCPQNFTNEYMVEQALELEELSFSNKRIKQSDGASFSYSWYNFMTFNSNGLANGYKTTRYNKTLSLIAEDEFGMQTDYAFDSTRDYRDMRKNSAIANEAVNNCLRRMKRLETSVVTGVYPVIFVNQLASKIISGVASALSGASLYRKLSFLNDSIGNSIMPNWIDIYEDPFIVKGMSSCYFDNEGFKVSPRYVVEKGVVCGYLLSNYTARKMNMQPTGNAGGAHNLIVSSNIDGDYMSLVAKVKTGLLVIDTIGHGLNLITGDYSVGASGLWIENGEIVGFVDNLTISGNIKEMLDNIQYIAKDALVAGGIRCGAMLIDNAIQISA